jgi:hypothetical protein
MSVTNAVPTGVAVSDFNPLFSTGSTGLEALTGASGINLSRSDVSTFNNIRSSTLGRAGAITYPNLILQARVGNVIRITIEIQTNAAYTEWFSFYIKWSTSYVRIAAISANFSGFASRSFDYTIPAGTAPGSYALACLCEFNTLGDSTYRSVNYYTLQIW